MRLIKGLAIDLDQSQLFVRQGPVMVHDYDKKLFMCNVAPQKGSKFVKPRHRFPTQIKMLSSFSECLITVL